MTAISLRNNKLIPESWAQTMQKIKSTAGNLCSSVVCGFGSMVNRFNRLQEINRLDSTPVNSNARQEVSGQGLFAANTVDNTGLHPNQLVMDIAQKQASQQVPEKAGPNFAIPFLWHKNQIEMILKTTNLNYKVVKCIKCLVGNFRLKTQFDDILSLLERDDFKKLKLGHFSKKNIEFLILKFLAHKENIDRFKLLIELFNLKLDSIISTVKHPNQLFYSEIPPIFTFDISSPLYDAFRFAMTAQHLKSDYTLFDYFTDISLYRLPDNAIQNLQSINITQLLPFCSIKPGKAVLDLSIINNPTDLLFFKTLLMYCDSYLTWDIINPQNTIKSRPRSPQLQRLHEVLYMMK